MIVSFSFVTIYALFRVSIKRKKNNRTNKYVLLTITWLDVPIKQEVYFFFSFDLNMFLGKTKRFIVRPHTTWIILQLQNRNSSTTPSAKLTSSYYHHVSPLPYIYKTISQNFDETAAKYSDHECYVFKSISLTQYRI
jgi:hypothetical protein